MSYEASVNRVTTINEALARMAEIDPTIGARDVLLSVRDFGFDEPGGG
jgi:hypothetical protein